MNKEVLNLMEEQNLDFEKDCIKLNYISLMLEVTRRCNLKCAHCMRGEPQNIDMSNEIIEKIFSEVETVFHLSLTGGEPFLAPDAIEKMVDVIIQNKIKVWYCTTVENGTILDERAVKCIEALNRLGAYIYNSVWEDKEREEAKQKNNPPIIISISNSEFHENNVSEAIDFYRKYANEYAKIDDQGEWDVSFVNKSGETITKKNRELKGRKWLKKEGRAKENNLAGGTYITNTYNVELIIEDNAVAVRTDIHICANGNVSLMLPLSFDSLDSKSMGNILTDHLSCMIHKWNWDEPLTQAEVTVYCKNLDIINNPKVPEKIRAEKQLQNIYYDLKKTMYAEGHKEYPYLNKKDLALAATCKIALDMAHTLQQISGEVEEQEIIDTILDKELTDYKDYEGHLTREDLEIIIDNMINKNNLEHIKQKGIGQYLIHQLSLYSKHKRGIYQLYNTFEK